MSREAFLLCLSAVCFGALPVLAEGPVTLRHRFTVGQDVVVEGTEDASVEVTVEGNVTKLAHKTDSVRRFHVAAIDPMGNATVRVEISEIHMEASSSEGMISFDSSSSETPHEQFKEVSKTIGKPLAEFVVSPLGEIVSVTPLHESAAELDTATRSLEHPFVRLPSEPVGTGDEWSETFKVVIKKDEELPQAVKMKRTYQIESIADSIVTASWRTLVLTPIKDPALESDVVQRSFDGTFRFNVRAGQTVNRSAKSAGEVVGFQGSGSQLNSKITRSESIRQGDRISRTATDGNSSR